ncbi:MAG: protease complex subunit PrcB family protein [Vicinamibacterales bacterium]
MIAAATLLAMAFMQGAQVPVRIVEQGHQSLVEDRREEVVRTPETWTTIWHEHSLADPPAIDFQREQVAAIFLGTRMSAGYSVEIVGVSRAGDGAVLRYRERRPPPDAVAAQVLTFPYCIVAVPASAGALRIERVE